MNNFSLIQRIQQIPLVWLCLILLIASLGIAVLYSAANGHMMPWAGKQLIRLSLSFLIMLFIASIDIRVWMAAAYPIYGVSLILLIAVELLGFVGMGAQRWLDLYFFNLQPSELMKIALTLSLARYYHHLPPEEIQYAKNWVIPTLLISMPVVLAIKQPDLGTAVLLALSAVAVMFAAGVRILHFAIAGLAVLVMLPIAWHMLYEYQKKRILIFLNPDSDPTHSGYHVMQSKIAIGSGGVWGKGFMQGSQSHLNFLPERQTDFIFTMFCEEFGLVGAVTLICLYVILIGYGLFYALRCRMAFGYLVTIGVTSALFLYVFINMAMVMGLMPVVGVPLPLFSYGGTAMLTLFIGFGLVLSAYFYNNTRMGKFG